jgi:hypothetical protein
MYCELVTETPADGLASWLKLGDVPVGPGAQCRIVSQGAAAAEIRAVESVVSPTEAA